MRVRSSSGEGNLGGRILEVAAGERPSRCGRGAAAILPLVDSIYDDREQNDHNEEPDLCLSGLNSW